MPSSGPASRGDGPISAGRCIPESHFHREVEPETPRPDPPTSSATTALTPWSKAHATRAAGSRRPIADHTLAPVETRTQTHRAPQAALRCFLTRGQGVMTVPG